MNKQINGKMNEWTHIFTIFLASNMQCQIFSNKISPYGWNIHGGVKVLRKPLLIAFPSESRQRMEKCCALRQESTTAVSPFSVKTEKVPPWDTVDGNITCVYSWVQLMNPRAAASCCSPNTFAWEMEPLPGIFPSSFLREIDLDNGFNDPHHCTFRDCLKWTLL